MSYGSPSVVSTTGTSAGGVVQLQGVVVDAVSSLRPVWELLDAGVPVVHPADLTVLQPSDQISHKQAARSARRRTLRRENRNSETENELSISKHPPTQSPFSDLHHLCDERPCSCGVEREE